MNRDPRFALSQELEAKQTLLRALATDDPDFFIDIIEGETNLLELIAALDASIVDDETLADAVDPVPRQIAAHVTDVLQISRKGEALLTAPALAVEATTFSARAMCVTTKPMCG